MNFYAFHLGDYASATAHLSWDEDMAYRRLLDVYYSREAPIPTDSRQVHRLARAATQEQRESVDTVLQEFFEPTDNGWVHYRCEAEIHAVAGKREKASQSAKARWNKQVALPSQSERSADALRAHNERINEECERIENGCEGNAPIPTPIPTPNKEPAAVVTATPAKPKRKTKSALPATFLLTTDMAKWARDRAPSVNLNTETEKFCNHWRSKGETRADWLATWYNWMLRAQEYGSRGVAAKTTAPDFHSNDTSWANDLGPL